MRPYIIFGGDVVLTQSVSQKIKENNLFCDGLQKEINGAHEFVINLEAPLTNSQEKTFKSGPLLKSDIAYGKLLPELGVSVVCLANNHMLDYSDLGLTDTISVCKANKISTIGAGASISEAKKPLFIKAHDKTIALINIAENEFGAASETSSGIYTIDFFDNLSLVRETKSQSDFLIVTMHAGVEHLAIPPPFLKKYCRFLVGEGVDAIICHHNHTASAYEVINGAPVFYGIGNLIFDSANNSKNWKEGFLVKLFLDNSGEKFEVIPYEQDISCTGVNKLKENKLAVFSKRIEELNKVLSLEDLHLKMWRDYCSDKSLDYMILLYFPFIQWPLKVLKKIPLVRKIVFPHFRSAIRLNLLRCESHFEVINEIQQQLFKNK